MRSTIIRAAARIAAVAVLLLVGTAAAASSRPASTANQKIKARVGAYTLTFTPKSGAIAVSRGGSAVLQIRELGGHAKVNLLKSTKRITHSGTNWTLSGKAPWASFQLTLTASSPTSDGQPSGNALIGLTLKVKPSKDAPAEPGPDVTLLHAPAAALKVYAAAPPVAGNNLFLSNTQLGSTILYFSDYTALGPYFDRTRSGVTQPNFPYPRAGTKGSLVGVAREALSRNSGARGLRAILEHAMLDIMYDVPGRNGIKEVVINEDVITKREPPLIVYQKEAELA